MLTAGIVVVILFTPTYLQQVFHVPARYALQANTCATFTFALGCLVFGWASDRFGTRATMIVGFARAAGQQLPVLLVDARRAGVINRTYALTGFFVGAVTMVPIVALRLFPAPVRFSGLSFSYNVSYAIFGGLTPVVLTLWLRTDADGAGLLRRRPRDARRARSAFVAEV